MPIQLSVKTRNARLVSKQFEDFAKEIPQISRGRIYGRMLGAMNAVSRYPGRYAGTPKHHWATDKQRRYVMWAMRAGVIKVPYTRTGRFADSWELNRTDDGYTLRSTYPAARYISGTARSPEMQYHIHRTRWMPLRTAVEDAMSQLPKEIKDNIIMVAKKRGF